MHPANKKYLQNGILKKLVEGLKKGKWAMHLTKEPTGESWEGMETFRAIVDLRLEDKARLSAELFHVGNDLEFLDLAIPLALFTSSIALTEDLLESNAKLESENWVLRTKMEILEREIKQITGMATPVPKQTH